MKNKISILLSMTLSVLIMLTNSCKKSESSPQTPVVIGQFTMGGRVAYILQPGDSGYDANVQHGLIAAQTDQSTGIKWYNGTNTTTGATGSAIGTGKSNTARIVASQGPGYYAAIICDSLTLNGYKDWYLPSRAELNQLYINQGWIGGFYYMAYYWSSTECDNVNAWNEDLGDGFGVCCYKYDVFHVRAVRSF